MEADSPYEWSAAPRRGWWWALAWLVAVVAITATGLAGASHGSSAADDLDAIRRFVAEHPAYRSTSTSGDLRLETEQASRFEVHVTRHFGDDQFERIQLGRVSYTRSGADQWVRTEQPAGSGAEGGYESSEGDWFNYSPDAGVAVGSSAEAPTIDQLALIDLRRDGPGRLVGRYHLRDLRGDPFDQPDGGLLDARARRQLDEYLATEVDVTVEHTGPRLDAITTVRHGVDGDTPTLTRYRDWGAAITIAAPTDVDPTPDVDEAELAAFQPGPVLVPADLPEGWHLVSSYTTTRDAVNEECAMASLRYGPDESSWFASVTLLEPECPYLPDDLGLAEGAHVRAGDVDLVLHDPADIPGSDHLDGATSAGAVRVPQGWVLLVACDGQDVLERMTASLVPYDSAAMASATVKAPS